MKKLVEQQLKEAKQLIKGLRAANKRMVIDTVAMLDRHNAERKDRENQIVKLTQEAREARTHRNRVEEQLKTWTHALNRIFGIAVRVESPWIEFVCDYQTVRIHESNALKPLIDQVITSLSPLSKEALKSSIRPQNKFDGKDGWVDPDVVAGERDRAKEEAEQMLVDRGFLKEAAFLATYWLHEGGPLWDPKDQNLYPKEATDGA